MHLFGTYEYAHAFWSKLLVFPDDPLILLQVISLVTLLNKEKRLYGTTLLKLSFGLSDLSEIGASSMTKQ